MIRGTTPTHNFKLPFETRLVKEVMVIYAQDDKELFHKDRYDCKMEGNTISVTLTQDDTLLFNHKKNVQIQIRILTEAGDALASNIHVVSVKNCLNDEVIM